MHPDHSGNEVSDTSFSTTSSDELWSELEDLELIMTTISEARATCTPQLFESNSGVASSNRKKPKAWYVVLEGHNPGIYTTWSDASARVTFVRGARHESFPSYEQALHAWRQNCLAVHAHGPNFIDGSTFEAPLGIVPQTITPPPVDDPHVHRVVTPPVGPSVFSGRAVVVSPSSLPASPSKKRVARAFFGPDSPVRQRTDTPKEKRWGVVADGVSGWFTAEEADAVVTEAERRGVPVQVRQVDSVVDMAAWLERLDLETENGSSVLGDA
ncbi:hypothetical protein K435DRAFT_876400 [Dendrothele bispora CBS 962.96]|uniref:Ribonuclease H1 N-terminal domain-containing protein n=1 Tax=Dendrothele bispora (strain CBS 962.96) TaxID=1314807 RepID=A0A4S8KS72_DENBC|nr:hypothetical protein K435DRAFT_876400 [Dendrothele bispora CBS 962.96]